jgi:lipopolysaccharide transport system permease protein
MVTADAQSRAEIDGPGPAGGVVREIHPGGVWWRIDFAEMWRYRELLYFFVLRDVKVRYKQTLVGGAWAIVQPLMTMVVFSIFFGYLAKLPTEGVAYPLFAYAALVPWTYFANSVTMSSNSVVDHGRMLTKVYFPRVFLPASAVLSGLVDVGAASIVLAPLMVIYGVAPTPRLLAVPFLLLFVSLCALAVGLWLSAVNAIYRDVRYTLPFLMQLWLFASPVAYSSSLVPEWAQPLYGINPMTGAIEGFRWALLGVGEAPGAMLAVSALAVTLLLAGGLFYFRKMESYFSDVV